MNRIQKSAVNDQRVQNIRQGMEDGAEAYEVEYIVCMVAVKGTDGPVWEYIVRWVGYPEDNTVYAESNFAAETLAQFRRHLEPASLRADGKYSLGDRVYPRQSYINMRILECAIERRRAQDGNRNSIIEEVNLRPDFSFSMQWRRERPIRIRIVGKFGLPSLSLAADCDEADVGHWFIEDLLEELEGADEAAEDEATPTRDGAGLQDTVATRTKITRREIELGDDGWPNELIRWEIVEGEHPRMFPHLLADVCTECGHFYSKEALVEQMTQGQFTFSVDGS
ncbi:hypothetical protein AURDEDRAFT_158605 [Auricularia subglabra TFB-10046 SS5]|nr:hypothetical protein AURDEDRAFT_158605 [Auricularia subglabra TFB-10046 SS5]